jgi:exodeoxyribonuclease VII large subunit
VSMLQRAAASGRFDALLVARGGGSLEDLWSFNDEALVRAIAASTVPVVSAVGHETDFTLADFAADLRAPTPSVAAELLVPDRADLVARLRALQQRLQSHHLRRLRDAMQRADRAALRLNALRPQARLQQLRARQEVAMQRLASTFNAREERRRARLRHAEAVLRAMAPRRRLAALRERLAMLHPRPQAAIARRLQRDALRLRGLARSLETVSPLATVARGYAILQHEDGRVVRTLGDARVGDPLDARLADGTLRVRVEGAGSS